jgi:hypothetical protein
MNVILTAIGHFAFTKGITLMVSYFSNRIGCLAGIIKLRGYEIKDFSISPFCDDFRNSFLWYMISLLNRLS